MSSQELSNEKSSVNPAAASRSVGHDRGWIGVDFDGTLAVYEKWEGPDKLGAPIPKMLARVIRWLQEGKDVRIFTARVSHAHPVDEIIKAEHAISDWCAKWIGQRLPILYAKDMHMLELWDDRAVQVIKNTGETLSDENDALTRKLFLAEQRITELEGTIDALQSRLEAGTCQ